MRTETRSFSGLSEHQMAKRILGSSATDTPPKSKNVRGSDLRKY